VYSSRKKGEKKAEVAVECSCLAVGAVRHPGCFHGSTLINPARESSAHRPQQLRHCLFHVDMGSLPLFSLLQITWCEPARSLHYCLPQASQDRFTHGDVTSTHPSFRCLHWKCWSCSFGLQFGL